MNNRISYIDSAKGIAIILVVFGHVLCKDLYFKASTESQLYQFIYSFHMPLFIFLSGLVSVTKIKLKQIPKDIYKRFRMLFLPFLIIGGGYSLIFNGNFGFIYQNMKWGYWYLWVLFVLYILIYPFFKIGKGYKGILIQCLVGFAIWNVFRISLSVVPRNIADILSLEQIFICYPYFLVANIIKRNQLYEAVFSNSWIFIVSLLFWLSKPYLIFPMSDMLVRFAAILVIMNITRKFDLSYTANNKCMLCLQYIGKNTLYIYVFHYFAIHLMRTTFLYDFLPMYSNIGMDLILSLIPAAIAIAFSLIMKFIIQSEPNVMKFLFYK